MSEDVSVNHRGGRSDGCHKFTREGRLDSVGMLLQGSKSFRESYRLPFRSLQQPIVDLLPRGISPDPVESVEALLELAI